MADGRAVMSAEAFGQEDDALLIRLRKNPACHRSDQYVAVLGTLVGISQRIFELGGNGHKIQNPAKDLAVERLNSRL